MNKYSALELALRYLPTECRYHGDQLDRNVYPPEAACCDTGQPARARREAFAALARLRAGEDK